MKVSKEQALQIVKKNTGKEQNFLIEDSLPDNCRVYSFPKNCWYILCDNNSSVTGIFSSRLICVCKNTGKILFDGSANNEG